MSTLYTRPQLITRSGIILMIDAPPLIKDHIAAQVHGIGVPPLKELIDFLVARNVRISVCEPSGRALGITEDDFAGKNVSKS